MRKKLEDRRPAPVKKSETERKEKVYARFINRPVHPRHEAIIDFLNENKDLITLSTFSKSIDADNTNLCKAVKRAKLATGYTCTIPQKHWPAAEAEIEKLKERFKKAAQCQ